MNISAPFIRRPIATTLLMIAVLLTGVFSYLQLSVSALPDVDVSGLLKEIIKENVYRNDYENLTIQLLEENISYDMAIESLKKLAESKFFDS